MALTAAAALAGTAATAAYLDAKFHIKHDLSVADLYSSAAKARKYAEGREAKGRLLVYHLIEEQTWKRPNKLFLEYEGRSWTYKQAYEDIQRVANWLMNDLKIEKGDVVAIDGPNSAEYMLIWFALGAIGAVVSFINCHLTGSPLVHSVKLCKTRYLLAEHSMDGLVTPYMEELNNSGIKTLYYDQAFVDSLSDSTPIPRSRTDSTKTSDIVSLIYTSGTTGLPKGVMIAAGRQANTARGMAEYLRLKPTDKFYTCLPLYHGAAQGLCTTPVIYAGASMVLGRKFSHATFWPEVSRSGANKLQYVGELCRYLVNSKAHPLEQQHKVHEAWGNGMRPDVWAAFRERFNIPKIHELYAATDGLGSTFNPNFGEFTQNAIGLRGLLWHRRNSGIEVRAKIDPDTEDLVKDENGFAIKCKAGEPGEVLHKVDPAMKAVMFRGYFGDEQASEKRWLHDVFEKGDFFFRAGDVLTEDHEGRVFFIDRLGDTFRWKSENVSTNEVSDVLGRFPQIAECSVYGVSVPNADGRCGCATIVIQPPTTVDTLDLQALTHHVTSMLPKYAIPLFLRVTPALSYTGTFKIQKGEAKREGINVDLIETGSKQDRLFWLPPNATTYTPYSRKDWEALRAGSVKL